MSIFMLETDALASASSTISSLVSQVENLASNVSGYDTSCEDGFNFDSARSVIAQNIEEARSAVTSMMSDKIFGESGNQVVIEEFLEGPEVSALAFTDGKTIKPMITSCDHKRAKDNDEGLNTGGMGTIAPNPYYTEAVAKECMEKIFIPTNKSVKNVIDLIIKSIYELSDKMKLYQDFYKNFVTNTGFLAIIAFGFLFFIGTFYVYFYSFMYNFTLAFLECLMYSSVQLVKTPKIGKL